MRPSPTYSTQPDAGHDTEESKVRANFSEQKFLQNAFLQAAERESRRVGKELHDDLCQHLLGAAFAVKAVAETLPTDSVAAAELDEIAHLVSSAVQRAREIARGLNPTDLNAANLDSALRDLARRNPPGIACRVECLNPVLLPDAGAALHAYRIAQEALSNAASHSGGSEVVVRLRENGDQFCLEIADNGRGLSPDARMGLGIAAMEYRAQAIGGRLSINTPKAGGVTVRCMIPKRS